LTEWEKFSGNNAEGLAASIKNQKRLRRYATIGLISRKKKQCTASDAADKENGDMQSRVATRRNLKAQQKAARKEFRHLSSNV